jgi:hypothetical protein
MARRYKEGKGGEMKGGARPGSGPRRRIFKFPNEVVIQANGTATIWQFVKVSDDRGYIDLKRDVVNQYGVTTEYMTIATLDHWNGQASE